MAEDKRRNKSSKDLGLGRNYSRVSKRLVNKDGSFNIARRGVVTHVYHWLINISWWQFSLLVLGVYIVVNALFAALYLIIGSNGISELQDLSGLDKFLYAFYFSTQTLTTVGYGAIHPIGRAANVIASLEALVGLLSFALATGLMYGRFSKPSSGIVFTPHALIAPYREEKTSFQFRIANRRDNDLLEIDAQVLYTRLVEENGVIKRRYEQLNLEIDHIYFLALNWTIVHPIDENSPLYGKSAADFEKDQAEFLVLIKAFNESFSQTVHSRVSYRWDEIIWNARFNAPYKINADGDTLFDINQLASFDKTS